MFARPTSPFEAVKLKAEYPYSTYMAGATDVAVELHLEKITCTDFIDLNRIDGMHGIDLAARNIGALTTFSDILEHEKASPELVLLQCMAKEVASPQIRNRATIGGNVANAKPASDSIPALLVLNSVVQVMTQEGERHIPLSDYLDQRISGDHSALITSISYEPLPQGAGFAYSKIGRRSRMSIARLNACGVMKLNGNTISEIRLSIGAASRNAKRLSLTESMMKGMLIDETCFQKAGEYASNELRQYLIGRDSADYKLQVIRDIIPKLLTQCLARIGGTR